MSRFMIGILSGKAAGCKTLALLTSHSREQIKPTGPDYTVRDLSRCVWSHQRRNMLNFYPLIQTVCPSGD